MRRSETEVFQAHTMLPQVHKGLAEDLDSRTRNLAWCDFLSHWIWFVCFRMSHISFAGRAGTRSACTQKFKLQRMIIVAFQVAFFEALFSLDWIRLDLGMPRSCPRLLADCGAICRFFMLRVVVLWNHHTLQWKAWHHGMRTLTNSSMSINYLNDLAFKSWYDLSVDSTVWLSRCTYLAYLWNRKF